MRTVTTLPSATEMVAALGIEPVGISHECDFPPSVRDRPSVTISRVDADSSSAEIDEQVLEAVESGDGVYDIDLRTLERLEPKLVLTQGICDVCAVDEVVVEHAVERIDAEPEILTTDPHRVGDVISDLERIGAATGRPERAREVIGDLENRIEAIRSRTDGSTSPRASTDRSRPRVAIFDWTDPVMIAGHWTAELVEWAGGTYGLADPGERSRPREWEAICAYDPEVIVVAPCGFDLEQTASNLEDLTSRPGWEDLTAVENDRVWAMDGDQYLNRPGPRLVDTLEALAPIVSPETFPERPPESVAVPISRLEAMA